jgi:4-hydroxy-tetrahydrodipicolinate synthase
MPDFRGSFTVQVTPFTEDGRRIDVEAQRRYVDWQVEQGAPGLIVLGSTGEFLSVDDDERTELIRSTVEHAAGRLQVLAGTTNTDTRKAVRYTQEAVELGVDGFMIAPPYYVTPTEDEIVAYYGAICAVTDLPIMLYNNPFTTNVNMSADLVARLTARYEQVRYIKEASMDVARVYDIVEKTDGVMNVFAGERITESFLLGAVGYVNPFGNYVPRPSIRIFELLEAGEVEGARRIQRHLDRIDDTIAEGHPLYGHQCYSKALAAAAGYPMGDVRAPLTTFASLGDEGRERVERLRAIIADAESVTAEYDGVGIV